MTKADLPVILGAEMIRSTEYSTAIELRPRGILSDHGARLERLINTFIATYPKVFYCPHEPDEGERSGAKYRQWAQVEANTWMMPPAATANDVMYDPAYPHGWTIYSGPAPLSESDWQYGTADRVALLAALIKNQSVAAIVVSDPDGTPWLVGLEG